SKTASAIAAASAVRKAEWGRVEFLADTGSRTPKTISCPAFAKRPASALPTLPAPMIAIFMSGSSPVGACYCWPAGEGVTRERRMAGRLKDRVAIVVGAGSSGPGWGNGKCTAITFAREGARVFCVDRKRAAAEETVGLIAKEGGDAHAFECDASNSTEVKALGDACLAKWGRIDVLDNNVGIGSTGGPVQLSEDEWHKVFDVNVTSFFLTAKHVLPVMEKQGKGAIVNVSSIASIRVPKGISYV